MRLFTLFLAAAIGTHVSSSSIEKLIVAALQQIQVLTNATTYTIAAFNGSSIEATLPIDSATATVISAIQNSTHAVQQTSQNLTDATSQAIGPYTQILAYYANASVATLISKKPDLAKLNTLPLVVMSLQQQANASNSFSEAVLAKIPETERPFALAINSQLSESLQQGIDCFSGMNETCNTNIVNGSRTIDMAMQIGAIPKSDGERNMKPIAWTLVLTAVFAAVMGGL
ncbi:hypothetical protein PRZ48_011045 [Zasmidium cellare]|uniref:Uncharacterized protein n=1 Tax=Zasmidium cellare TaxID=395010 RepID=A0ABR0EAD0_ZASCE|nr:hypothetical protein PRZ48_011045 [Zasmidium cellare]